ncbi:g8876 [Coccomyxa elongata]
MGMSARPRPAPIPGYVRLMQSGLGWGALVIAGMGLVLVLGRLPDFLGGLGRSSEGGKWIRDRSLGGKMVFVPDAPSTVPQRDSVGTAEDVEVLRSSASASVAAPLASEQRADGDSIPEWWNPSPALHVSLYYKQEADKTAKAILKEIEDAKLAGYDYPISSLIALRQVCGEAGVSVRPRTTSGRDAMLRAGAEAAVDAAMQQSGAQLAGMAPSAFVTGLARDLEVPEDKAANIALAVIAAKARGALIDACAAYRENDSQEALFQLLRIAGLLESLPLPPRSPHADMVAASISQRATLQEREAIFMTYGRMEPSTADRVAEMLGFDPALVLPQLHAALEQSTP